jgi:UDP-N-acetylmuramyl pentapeptide phosphotransferase/UDP-N-acetylglucosamine-1-phosphate transferase
MMNWRPLLTKYGTVLGATSISIIGSAAYAVRVLSPHSWSSFFQQISWIAVPGIMFAAVLTSVAENLSPPLTGATVGMVFLSVIALAILVANFLFYLGIGLAIRKLVRAVKKMA